MLQKTAQHITLIRKIPCTESHHQNSSTLMI